jgi:hypothetical protein
MADVEIRAMQELNELTDLSISGVPDLLSFIEFAREMNTTKESKYSREWWAIAAYTYSKLVNAELSTPFTIQRERSSKPDFWVHQDSDSLV